MEGYKVESIPAQETYEWLLKKHYAHRLPMAIEYAFGLYKEKTLIGVCVFGPTAPPVPITLFGCQGKHKVRELTRLVIKDKHEKNVLSFFVSQCLKMINEPMCIVSFADKNYGHHGYIYQATNWMYTGEGGGATVITDADGKQVHNLTITDGYQREKVTRKQFMDKHGISEVKSELKYRYLYITGNKKEKKEIKKDLLLNPLPYPKGENKRYDSSYQPKVQGILF
jgi:hypothetical protein